jgi:hypothetical protein
MFVAVLLIITGTLNLVYGIAAISNANFYGNESGVFASLHAFGWITVALGILAIVGGLSLFRRGSFGVVIGIIAAAFAAIGSLLSVGGEYPFWSLGIFAMCLICLHGLIVYGDSER